MAKKSPTKKMVKKLTKKVIKKASPKKITKTPAKRANVKVKPKAIIKKITKKVAVTTKKTSKKPVKVNVAKSISSLKKKTAKKVVAPTKKVTVKKAKSTGTSFVAHKTKLKTGDKAPYFEGKEQDGNTVSLAGLTGKTVILYFYPKDDTPGCTATACSLRDEYQYLNNSNYAVVGVSADDEKSHAKFAAKYQIPFPLIADVDLKIMKAYDVWGTKQFMGKIYDGIIRTTFVINPDGIIKEVITKVDTANHAQQLLAL